MPAAANMTTVIGPYTAVEVLLTHSSLLDPKSNTVLGASVNPFAAEVTFVQCTKKQIILKIIRTKSCGYSYESSH